MYGITINGTSQRPFIKDVALTFTLDGITAGSFVFAPDPTVPDYHFNVLFIGKVGLEEGPHVLVIGLQPHSFVLLDYLQYEYVFSEWDASASMESHVLHKGRRTPRRRWAAQPPAPACRRTQMDMHLQKQW